MTEVEDRWGRSVRDLWTLEPDCVFLNHGSYGATPREVMQAQSDLRARMESQPVRFFMDELPGLLRDAADALAAFVGCTPDRLVFVENATTGVNAVMRSLALRHGDEILTTGHVYGAVRHVLRHVAEATGARVVEARVGMPVADDETVIEAISRAITPRTRLAVIDHVASASAVRFPVAAIAHLCRESGVRLLVDGAHGPGMAELHVDGIGADWYVGNCHKWLCAPKGSAFLAIAPGAGAGLHPGTISHNYGQGFVAEFDKIGTRDATSWLAVPAAIAFHQRLGGAALRTRNRALAARGGRTIAAALGAVQGASQGMFESMATIRLPIAGDRALALKLRETFWRTHAIEVPVMPFDDGLWLRISAQAYNEPADYERLAACCRTVLQAV